MNAEQAKANRYARLVAGIETAERFGARQYDREGMQVFQAKARGESVGELRAHWARAERATRRDILAAGKSVTAYRKARPEIQASVYRRFAHSSSTTRCLLKTRRQIMEAGCPRGQNACKRFVTWTPAHAGIDRVESERYLALLNEIRAVELV